MQNTLFWKYDGTSIEWYGLCDPCIVVYMIRGGGDIYALP